MIKNKAEIKKIIESEFESIIENFVSNLDKEDEEFTIDRIEEIMGKFHQESKAVLIAKVNEVFTRLDETEMIAKKKKK